MRTLSDTLLAAQKAVTVNALVKIVLTYDGNSYTYTKPRIINVKNTEDGSLQYIEILLDNSDGVLTDIDLKGYKGVLSNGANTFAGEEYSALAPMWVLAQEFDSDPNKLTCTLSLVGICNLMSTDEASEVHMPDFEKSGTATDTMPGYLKDTTLNQFTVGDVGKTVWNSTDNTYAVVTLRNSPSVLELDTDIMEAGEDYKICSDGIASTVKTLVNAIAGATLACFSLCKAYEVVWDDGYDDLADTYRPKDAFRIYVGNNRLSAINRLLDYTKNVIRAEADGKLHIFKPTTSGETYDSEYSLESGQHQFFAKALRNRLVTPNYIKVQSQEDDDPQYSGYAKDDSYDSLPAELKKHKFKKTRLESDEQGEDIAKAILAKIQMWCEAGSASVPLNVGQEAFDYVKVTDSRESDYRVGNIGRIVRHYNATKNEWRMTFVFGNWQNVRKVLADLGITSDDLENYFSRLSVKNLYAENILVENVDFVWIDPEGNIDLDKIGDNIDNLADGEYFARERRLHLDATGVYVHEETRYTLRMPDEGDNNLWKSLSAPTAELVGDIWLDLNYTPNKVKRWTGSAWEEVSEADRLALEKGVIVRRLKGAALTADGLIVLDETQVGTYGLVLTTDISAGHILLSKTTKDGLWYEESGVVLDATYGIALYGGEGINAFRTFATAADYEAGTPVQVYIGTDGKLYAGGGKVSLDSNGILIDNSDDYTNRFALKYGANTAEIFFLGLTLGLYVPSNCYIGFWVGSSAKIYLDGGSLYPSNTGTMTIGKVNKQFYGGYYSDRLKIPVGTDKYD